MRTYKCSLNLCLLSAIIILCLLLAPNVASAGPITTKCNGQSSQGPEGVISRISCFKSEYLRLLELKEKIKMFIGFGNGIRGRVTAGEQKKHQCRDGRGIYMTYKVPKEASGGRCSPLKNKHSQTYDKYYNFYCLGYSAFGKEMRALHAKVVQLKDEYEQCFDESVKLLIPADIRRGDPSDFTGHSSFNDRDGFVTALNQLRNRWKANNYEEEIETLARSCNDLLAYTESNYPEVTRSYKLHCQ